MAGDVAAAFRVLQTRRGFARSAQKLDFGRDDLGELDPKEITFRAGSCGGVSSAIDRRRSSGNPPYSAASGCCAAPSPSSNVSADRQVYPSGSAISIRTGKC